MWTDGWWPAKPVTVRTIDTRDGSTQKLIVHPGQFLPTSGGEDGVTGTERLWIDLDVELIRGSAAENTPPAVRKVDLVKVGDTVTAKVDASDASGVPRVDVTHDGGGSAAHVSRSPVAPGADGTYDVSFDAPGIPLADVAVTVYVVDGAGNVTSATAKGELVPSTTHALTASAAAHGSISPTGTVTASDGADQTFTITPDAHYHVAEVVVDAAPQGPLMSYTFSNVTEDHTIAASFSADQAALSVTTVGNGSVSKDPDQAIYGFGSSVQLTAAADPGWQFSGWGGDVSGTANPLTVTMDSDRSITANFVEELQVSTLAGSAGLTGSADGAGNAARFYGPSGVTCDAVGTIYVADDVNSTIRKVASDGLVTTLAGSARQYGSVDANGSTARFNQPMGVACDVAGNVYVADSANHTIRAITPTGDVTTFAGSPGIAGSDDGAGSAARFQLPSGVACDASGNVYVADHGNQIIRKITPGGHVSTLAGSAGDPGGADGVGATARFSDPAGVACDADGNIYVADAGNHTVRKITPTGVVTTLAGSPGQTGSTDGTGSAARFQRPEGVTCDAAGNIYVADDLNSTIRRVTPTGVVTTLAGSAGHAGDADGTGGAARFYRPFAVACDAVGNVYIADFLNHTIRKAVSPSSVGGFLRVTQASGGSISKSGETEPAATCVAVEHGDSQTFNITPDAHYHIVDVVVDGASQGPITSYIFGGVSQDHTVTASFAIDSFGLTVTTVGQGDVARVPDLPSYDYGDSTQLTANADPGWRFGGWSGDASGGTNPLTVTIDADKTIVATFVEELQVSTLAGSAGLAGSADGTGTGARFDVPQGVACDSLGNVYVAEHSNHTVRKITPVGQVTTLAGSAGDSGSADGNGSAARFNHPFGVAIDASGTVYVADTSNFTIRKVTAGGDVTTFAGSAGNPGSVDGTGAVARFSMPLGLACDPAGDLYVADVFNNTIRKVTPDGQVTTLAGSAGDSGSTDGAGSAARFNAPGGVACDALGNVFVADTGNHTVRKITPAGAVTTVAGSAGGSGSADGLGSAARFSSPVGIACDQVGNVYVGDYGNSAIRRISPAGLVTTVAGSVGNSGSTDGIGSAARFDQPLGIACDAVGNVYIADGGNCTIRRALRPATVGGVLSVIQTSGGTLSTAGQTSPAYSQIAVAQGADQTITVTPDPLHRVVDVTVDGLSQGAITSYTFFSVTEDHSITASFALDAFIEFAPKVDYATGSIPLSVARGEFNGDGEQDLVTANFGASSVSVLLGNGDGTLRAKLDCVTSQYPRDTAVADYDGDGKQDLAVGTASSMVSVLLGNGDGTFRAKVDYAAAQDPMALVVGDFNGDGNNDLAEPCLANSTVSVLLGNGDGTFQAKVEYATGANPQGAASADLNGDGWQDLVTANGGGDSVSILLGNGDGTFKTKVDFEAGLGATDVAVADFDEDGRQDLVTCSAQRVGVLLGNGDGTFAAGDVVYPVGHAYTITIADVNADGKQDLATSDTAADTIAVLLGMGDGRLLDMADFATGSNPYANTVADLDGDGRLDLVTANQSGQSVSVLLNTGPTGP